jgi:site-specific DNA recombinase
MPNMNGHGPKRAILYARVSTDEQARSGYSLAQQIEALRAYATQEGYEILEEVVDPGQSGASLERPGMDRVWDLVVAGGVSVVLAQDRDRFAREPAYHYLLRKEFEEHGTKLRALNDRGDDSPEGELTDGVLDQLAKYERAKFTERSRRGKLQKARQGKIIATMKPPYGFRYNEARDALVIHEPERRVVERIFRLAAEGRGTKAIQTRLYRESVPSPTGKELWHRPVLKRMVLSDIYKPHTYEETLELVPEQAVAYLQKDKSYGIRWWNRSSQKSRQVSESSQNGQRHYRRKVAYTPRHREEWIASPVPAFLPRELVETARAMMSQPRPQERRNLARGWELRGLIRCPSCGGAMTSHTAKRGEKVYHYYRCHRSVDYRRNSCRQKMERAQKAEEAMWDFVSRVLKDPDRILAGMDALIERKRAELRGDPDREAREWLERLAEVDQERRGYLKLAATGRMSEEELDEILADLEETRRTAERELEAIGGRREEIEQLERDRDAIKASWAAAVPGNLDRLTPEGRNELYLKLRLEISPTEDGYEIMGPFCTFEPLSSSVDPCRVRSPCTPPRSPRRRLPAGCGPCRRSVR